MNTVDVVIIGADANAVAGAIDAARRGDKVLVVIRSRRASLARRFRQCLRAAGVARHHVSILTGAELACVDGVHAIEAVVIRYLRTGRLAGINASALLTFETGGLMDTSDHDKPPARPRIATRRRSNRQ
jgi:thioredoxin reductase